MMALGDFQEGSARLQCELNLDVAPNDWDAERRFFWRTRLGASAGKIESAARSAAREEQEILLPQGRRHTS
jgi:hypothetical protein